MKMANAARSRPASMLVAKRAATYVQATAETASVQAHSHLDDDALPVFPETENDVGNDHEQHGALRRMLVHAVQQSQHRNRHQTATDAEQPAKRTQQRAQDDVKPAERSEQRTHA